MKSQQDPSPSPYLTDGGRRKEEEKEEEVQNREKGNRKKENRKSTSEEKGKGKNRTLPFLFIVILYNIYVLFTVRVSEGSRKEISESSISFLNVRLFCITRWSVSLVVLYHHLLWLMISIYLYLP